MELCGECDEQGYRMYVYGTPAMKVEFRPCPCIGGQTITSDMVQQHVEFGKTE